ncbi:MAG: VOC family protein [Pseudomonadota bacterium]
MPSFWMSYVHVADVDAMVAKARKHPGVIIEVEPQPFNQDARIALVRDPSGAGFTLFEGPDIKTPTGYHGVVDSRVHHVADVSVVENFYADLFGWDFSSVTSRPWHVFDILHPDGSVVAQLEEMPPSIRGKFSYWMPCFSVTSRQDTSDTITRLGGSILSELPGGRRMVADQQGAHFLIRSTAQRGTSRAQTSTLRGNSRPRSIAWKTILALVSVWLAVLSGVDLFWGVFFLIWTLPARTSSHADLLEPIYRTTQTILYWASVCTWVLLSLRLIAAAVLEGVVV